VPEPVVLYHQLAHKEHKSDNTIDSVDANSMINRFTPNQGNAITPKQANSHIQIKDSKISDDVSESKNTMNSEMLTGRRGPSPILSSMQPKSYLEVPTADKFKSVVKDEENYVSSFTRKRSEP